MIKVAPNFNLSDSEIIQNRLKVINGWKPLREVWSLKYGDLMIAGLACINGVIINSIFRKSLKLRHHGWKFTMLSVSAGPAIAAYGCHKTFITEYVLLHRPKCMTCEELKASAFLEGNALLYSLLIAPTINLAIAGSIGYRIPYIYEVKELMKFWWGVVRPQARIISFIFFCNIVVSSAVTYSQITSMEKITKNVLKIHKYLEDRKNTGMDLEPSNKNSLP